MADASIAALEAKIAELDKQIRRINVGVGVDIGPVADFSAGDCTNTCTGQCTNGCTGGCTGSCVTQREGVELVSQPAVSATDRVTAGVQLFKQLSGRG